MRRRVPKKKTIIITFVSVAMLLLLVLIGAKASRANFYENAIATIFTPVHRLSASASSAVEGFFIDFFRETDVDIENTKLKTELDIKNRTLIEMDELRKENERLRDLLNFSKSADFETGVTARVTGRSSNVYFRIFTLAAGSKSGVDINMPVICADGLVGIVSDVGSNWCKVTAVVDSTVSVPAMVERTRDTCIAYGVLNASKNENCMELHYIQSDRSDIVRGDILITSGIGGVYPKGIRIGTVTEVVMDEKTGIDAYIVPAVDFFHIEEMMIITDGEGKR